MEIIALYYFQEVGLSKGVIKMNKKFVIGIIAIVLIVSAAATVLAQAMNTQWLDVNMPLTATVSSSTSALTITSDNAAAVPVAAHNFGPITVGQSYEWTFYIYNSGSVGEFITYLPTNYGSSQTSIGVTATVVEYGVPGEMPLPNLTMAGTNGAVLPYSLPEKLTTNPTQGFYLMPSKMIKIDVKITVSQLDGTAINIPFEIAGAYVPGVTPS